MGQFVCFNEEGKGEDLLQLFEALLDCCSNILNIMVYPIHNGTLLKEICSINTLKVQNLLLNMTNTVHL